MKKILILLCFICLSALLFSTDFYSLDYLEGYLEVQTAGDWSEAYIGDEIPSDALLRLSDNGYAEILVEDAVITLIRDGNYSMDELAGNLLGVSSSNIDLSRRFTLNSDYEKWQQEATMGVRGSQQTSSRATTDMEDAYTYLNAGLESLAEENYDEALVNFEEGWDFFEDDNSLFFAAVSYDALGRKRDYVRSLQQVTADNLDEEFLSAYTIRMSDLLMNSLVFDEAVDMLEDITRMSVNLTEEESQNIRFLLGKGYLGLDRKQQAAKEFGTARDLDPSSEVGRLAADALSSL